LPAFLLICILVQAWGLACTVCIVNKICTTARFCCGHSTSLPGRDDHIGKKVYYVGCKGVRRWLLSPSQRHRFGEADFLTDGLLIAAAHFVVTLFRCQEQDVLRNSASTSSPEHT
jgi:hypothetical protein